MARILIVDDEPLNRELIAACFADAGHELIETADGEAALAAAASAAPDLVLLDVMLPKLDGFEVARRLKAGAQEFLPIVLITALADRASRVMGLDAGADDFLSKPIERLELLARARNLLSLREAQRALRRRNEELVELARFREEMISLVVHDLRGPLAAVLANLHFVSAEAQGEAAEALADCERGARRVQSLIQNLHDAVRLEQGVLVPAPKPVDCAELVGALARQHAAEARTADVAVELSLAAAPAHADPDLLARVVANLIENSLRHTPPGGRIAMATMADDGVARIEIANTGEPVAAEVRARLFEKYAATRGAGRLGVGLYFSRLVVEAHRGTLCLAAAAPAGFGVKFVVELPG